MKSAFRYPGSKAKIADGVLNWFPPAVTHSYMNDELACYCEPFVGCGAIALNVLPALSPNTRVVLNDKDYGIACIWRTILSGVDRLIDMLIKFQPSVAAFNEFKAADGDASVDTLTAAFRKFVLHQMSFSGLGAKAGGPIGGAKQRSDYAVDCRFRPERHAKVLVQQHKLLKGFANVEVAHGDFADALVATGAGGFAYLDPPYYLQGGALYKHDMEPAEHSRLAAVLRAAPYEWVLSYDDHSAVRELYAEWADVNSFEMVATIDTKRGHKSRRKNNELVITKRDTTEQSCPSSPS